MMLDAWRHRGERRDALKAAALCDFGTPCFVGAQWWALPGMLTLVDSMANLSSGQLAMFMAYRSGRFATDCWRYILGVQEAGKPADVSGYR
jgi:hypothetical protein